jgi:hypothetical protein
MKTRSAPWLIPAGAVLLGGVLLSRRPWQETKGPRQVHATAPLPEAARRSGPGGAGPTEGERARAAALVRLAEAMARAREPVVVRPGQRVMTVNGVPITGKDLLPFGASHRGEESVSPQLYAHLVNRAVERELAFQAAKEQGIQLGEGQRQEVERVREAARKRWISDRAALDFEARDAEGRLLLAELATRAGVPSPYATEADVERYYQAHREGLGDLPTDPAGRAAAWQRLQIEIRGLLAGELRAAHVQGTSQFIDELKARAAISEG